MMEAPQGFIRDSVQTERSPEPSSGLSRLWCPRFNNRSLPLSTVRPHITPLFNRATPTTTSRASFVDEDVTVETVGDIQDGRGVLDDLLPVRLECLLSNRR
jgi:hypothetical protein